MPTTYDVVPMTPELASNWLAKPWTRQRRISQPTVDRYAATMRDGRWQEPSLDPIALTEDGHLLNGQHRLTAVIAAEWSGDMLVARGVDPSAFPVIDTGRRRLAAQFVTAPQADAVAAVARMALWYAERWPAPPRGRSLTFDNDRLLEFIDAHQEEMVAAVRDADPVTHNGIIPRKTAASVLYLARAAGADPERVTEFIEGVGTGVNLGADDPRLVLRNRMLHAGASVLRRDSAAMWMLTVRAFNGWIQGRTMGAIPYEPNATPPVIDLTGRESVNAVKRAARLGKTAGRASSRRTEPLPAVAAP